MNVLRHQRAAQRSLHYDIGYSVQELLPEGVKWSATTSPDGRLVLIILSADALDEKLQHEISVRGQQAGADEIAYNFGDVEPS